MLFDSHFLCLRCSFELLVLFSFAQILLVLRFPEKMNSLTDHLCFFHFREKSVDFLPAPHKLTSKITAFHERVFTSKPDINLLSPGRNLDKWCNTLVQVVRRAESGKSGGYSQQTVTTNLIYLFSVVSR